MAGDFGPWDWTVFIAMLVISAAIGVYHAVKAKLAKKDSADEVLMGGRDIGLLPIALSILVSFLSAIFILGVPAEMYTQGVMYFLYSIGFFFGGLVAAIVFVPLFHPLQLTSMYEYLELRFNAKSVKLTASLISITSMLLFNGVASFAPSTALEQVSGFPEWASFIIIGGVCTFYTCMGGLKAVVWVDCFQALIMAAGLLAIIIRAVMSVGGLGEVWQINEDWGRTQMFDFNPDPTVRHTFWSLTIASLITSAGAHGCSQTSIQRFCAVKTLRKAKIALIINICGNVLLTTMACLAGISIFAYFAKEGCDPMTSKAVSNPNQLVPYFVMRMLAYPGIPGLFIACLYSGALSTLSSNLSSLCALTWEDILKPFFKNKDEVFQIRVIRLLAVIYGAAGVGMTFLMQKFQGTVLQASISILGATAGPLTGIIILAAFFPCANWIGAIAGSISAYGITLWITVAKNDVPEIMPMLTYPTSTCPSENVTAAMTTMTMTTLSMVTETTTIAAENIQGLRRFYMLSYLWNAGFGLFICLFLGVVVSLITGRERRENIDPKFLISITDICCCCLPEKAQRRLRGGDKHYDLDNGEAFDGIDKEKKTDLKDIHPIVNGEKTNGHKEGYLNSAYTAL